MAWDGDTGRSGTEVDFFISYSPADEQWAIWVAWELEQAGYATMLQAWDFVPGTNFIDFMDRGVTSSTAVIAILSRNYVRSNYGRMEWQAAMRRSPQDPGGRLITVRIEDFPLEGLLATITFVDLVPVTDAQTARTLLLSRIRQAMNGRAKPAAEPGYPRIPGAVAGFSPTVPHHSVRKPADRRNPLPSRPAGQPVQLLQIAGPRFSRESPGVPPANQAKHVIAGLDACLDRYPDMLLLGGDVTAHGGLREFDVALEFVTDLRTSLRLESRQVAVVPGVHDVNLAACRAYFFDCEANDVEPEAPYSPKWRHYRSFLRELYAEAGPAPFRDEQPWDLIVVPDLRVAVATINSTMAVSHHDRHGLVGERQARWLAQALDTGTGDGWFRVGLINHDPHDPDLRDAEQVTEILGPRLDLFVAGRPLPPGQLGRLVTLIEGDAGIAIETRDL